jgi:hypothetical protein
MASQEITSDAQRPDRFPIDPVGWTIGELYVRRLGRVAGGQLLEQRYYALKNRYIALPLVAKRATHVEVIAHSTRCRDEFVSPMARLPLIFFDLCETYKRVYFAILNQMFAGARHGLTVADIRMREARDLCDALEVSVHILERWDLETRATAARDYVLDKRDRMIASYEHIASDWEGIDVEIRESAQIDQVAMRLCVEALEAPKHVVPPLQYGMDKLEEMMRIIMEDNIACGIELIEVWSNNAHQHCAEGMVYLNNLHRAVRQYQEAERRIKKDKAEAEEATYNAERTNEWANRLVDSEDLRPEPPKLSFEYHRRRLHDFIVNSGASEGNGQRRGKELTRGRIPSAFQSIWTPLASEYIANPGAVSSAQRNAGTVIHEPKPLSPKRTAAMSKLTQEWSKAATEESQKGERDSGNHSRPPPKCARKDGGPAGDN